MAELLTRDIVLNPLNEARLPYVSAVGLGDTIAQIWKTPQLSGLLVNKLKLDILRMEPFTPEQRQELDLLNTRLTEARNARQLGTTPEARLTAEQEVQAATTELQTWFDIYQEERILAGEVLEVDTLNELYGELLTFDEPTDIRVAEEMYNIKKEEYIRNLLISRGPRGAWAGLAKFGVSILDVVTDPFEIAIGATSVFALPYAGGSLGRRALIGAGEAFVGSTITEPLYFQLSRSQQLDYSMNEMLLNIGLGTLFGSALSGAFGSRTRFAGAAGDVRARLPTDPVEVAKTGLESDMATTALGQFVQGKPVNLSAFLEGRDLRSTTVLYRTVPDSYGLSGTRTRQGIAFQRQIPDILPRAAAESARPSILMGDASGAPVRYTTRPEAVAVADSVGGEVVFSAAGGFNVRRPLEGRFVLDAEGRPLVFPTQRTAKKFAQSVPEDVFGTAPRAVPLIREGQRTQYGVAEGMSDADIAAIQSGRLDLNIRPGVSAGRASVLPDAEARLDQAIKGLGAEHANAKRIVESEEPVREPEARTAIDVDYREDADAGDVSDSLTDLESKERELGDLSVEEQAIIDDARVFASQRYDEEMEIIKEAVDCAMKGAV